LVEALWILKNGEAARCARLLVWAKGLSGRLAIAALGSCSGSSGTTAATTAAATLACGTYSACRYRSTILGCAFGCLDLFATLVITLKLITVVLEVVAAF
jgi:hypothetical protein